MAKLYFHFATMNAGKSALLLQANYNYRERGMSTILFSAAIDDRYGDGKISSRIGIDSDCSCFSSKTNLYEDVKNHPLVKDKKGNERAACVFVDEAQFLTFEQVMELARVVDELDVPVMCYGLRTDFKGRLFEGSDALFRFADELRELRAVCHCGKRATMVLRKDENGNVLKDGPSVLIGGNDVYESVCREHWVKGMFSEK